MMRLLTVLALGAALPAATHAGTPGQAAAAAAPTDPAVAGRASKLAAMLNSEALIIGDAKSDEEAPWEAAQIERTMERVLVSFDKKKDRS